VEGLERQNRPPSRVWLGLEGRELMPLPTHTRTGPQRPRKRDFWAFPDQTTPTTFSVGRTTRPLQVLFTGLSGTGTDSATNSLVVLPAVTRFLNTVVFSFGAFQVFRFNNTFQVSGLNNTSISHSDNRRRIRSRKGGALPHGGPGAIRRRRCGVFRVPRVRDVAGVFSTVPPCTVY